MPFRMDKLLEWAARTAGVPEVAEASGRCLHGQGAVQRVRASVPARIGKDVKKDSDGNPVVQCPGCDQEAAIDVLEAATGLSRAQLTELGGQRFGGSRYSQDPYWMTAKYAGKDKDGTPFKKGDRVFYYPKGKVILAGKAAEQAAAEFQAAVDDERTYNQGAEW